MLVFLLIHAVVLWANSFKASYPITLANALVVGRPLGNSDHLRIDSATALNSSLPETVVILIHGITGPTDEFWYNGTHYSDGWFWQNPAPVWYETQGFRCL